MTPPHSRQEGSGDSGLSKATQVVNGSIYFQHLFQAPDPRPLALNLWATSLILKLPFVSESPRELEKSTDVLTVL